MTRFFVEAVDPDLKTLLQSEIKAIKRAPGVTIRTLIRELQLEIRAEVDRGIGKKRKVGGAIRSKPYDNPDGAAGIVWSKFGRGRGAQFRDYLLPFVLGLTLRPRRSKWLYISLEKGRKARRDRRLIVSADPKLKWIPIKDGRVVLLVRQTKTRSTVIAKLVKNVKAPKRLNFERTTRNLETRTAQSYLDQLELAAD
jgi:hypothetical protein